MTSIRPFQIILLGAFGFFALVGLIFFIMYRGGSTAGEQAYGSSVEVWGTLSAGAFNDVLAEVSREDKAFQVVQYVQKSESSFEYELLGAIAEGRSPDLIILSSEDLVTYRDRLTQMSFELIPERDYRDAYIDGTDIFLLAGGVYGIPFLVDPLIMYYNRDVLAASGIAQAPATWEELVNVTTPAVTRVGANREVLRSSVAMGEYTNVTNAKEILATLFMQAGSDIVTYGSRGYEITLGTVTSNQSLPPGQAGLSFYTQFANSSGATYTWNRSLPQDRLAFLSGDVAVYFGKGSEYDDVRDGNPNLNFDVTVLPQGAGATVQRGHGTFYAFAIPSASPNPNGAFAVARTLAAPETATLLSEKLYMAPVLRSQISGGTGDAFRRVIYRSALIAHAWLDPSSAGSENVFKTMIEDVTSGQKRVSEAVQDAIGRLRLLF